MQRERLKVVKEKKERGGEREREKERERERKRERERERDSILALTTYDCWKAAGVPGVGWSWLG